MVVQRQDSSDTDGVVERLDFGSFSKVKRTPQGGMRVPANLTRTGVFVYTRPDGEVVRELRHPDEVFAKDSLETLRSAPVTDRHPAHAVSPLNWRKLSIGHVGEDVKADGRFVAAKLMIQDADALKKIERDDGDPEALRETSCGYVCKLDSTPGTFNGETYDVVQRNIRYNHVALGPKNWGRAGSEVALRLDAKGNQTINPTGESASTNEREKPMKVIRIDGVEYEVGSDAHISKLEEMHKADLAKANTRADTAEGELAAEKVKTTELQTKLDTATDPKTIDKLVEDRAILFADARKMLGDEAKFDGKTDREIMVEAIRKDDDKFEAEGKSDDYVRAFFDARTKNVSRHDQGGNGIGAVRSAASAATRTDASRKDGDDEEVDRNDASAARKRMLENNSNAASQPLRKSTTRSI